MKLNCEREKFLHAFQTAASVVPPRSPKPILENVKLEAAPGRATLMATDLEIGIRIDATGVEVQSPGDVVLPIRRFGAILRESSDAKLFLESDGTRTLVRGGQSEWQLPTQNPDEFPTVSPFEQERYHQMPARFFRELIRRTTFATDTESSRYALGGVLVELTAQGIVGVGTDGRRLAKQEGPAEAVAGHETIENTVIPTRAMQLIERALADNEENIQLATSENQVQVKSQRTTIYSRLVEGRYPKWRDVFPKSQDTAKIELSAGPFHSAVRQAAIVTTDERRGVDFTFGEGKIVLAGHGAEMGESHVELPIAYEGPEITVKLDPRFMSDFLKVLELEQTFTLHLRDAESAVVCYTDDGYAYLIMPLSRE
ncbi:MAG: DNA polymerase III subunit beta [Planctomycetes bacterium RBG_16_64_12]|nr:MAG: DNA polymerase III subunit beta [Planctomycetes bacterium RBG_16_64_12]